MEIGINMKNALILLCILWGIEFANASCSTQITRTNSSPNTVLTSTKYNTDLNTVYTKVNDLDGDCITDDSLPWGSIDETTVPPLAKGAKEGCLATRSDANTISIDKCLIAVSGVQIEKTTATTVTWGCTGCSSEVNSTAYYVYATNASTLTLKISTTAPDAYGYNSTDRVLAYFYNNSAGDINANSVKNWIVGGFYPGGSQTLSVPGVTNPISFSFRSSSTGVISNTLGSVSPSSCVVSATSTYTCALPTTLSLAPNCTCSTINDGECAVSHANTTTSQVQFFTENSAGTATAIAATVLCGGALF
jgi:hypothetical protein